MNATPSQLVCFLARLRLQSAQFRISDPQFLAAHQLIGGLASDTDFRGQWPDSADEWCALLGPVLCSSAVEIEQFQKAFKRFFQSPQSQGTGSGDAPRTPKKRWMIAAGAGLAVCAIVAGIVISQKPRPGAKTIVPQPLPVTPVRPPDPNGRVIVTVTGSGQSLSDAIVKFRGRAPKTNAAGGVTADFTNWPGTHYLLVTHPNYQTDVETLPQGVKTWTVDLKPGIKAVTAGKSTPNWFGRYAVALYPAAILIPLLAFVAWLWRLLRSALELRRKLTGAHEKMQQIGFDQAGGNLFRGADIRRLATGLRRRRFEESDELAVAATAEATARASGFFTPVYARRQVEPEYLAILEQKNSRDHQARLQDELFSRLRDHDVAIRRYYFQNDPSVCFDSDSHVFSLQELAARHPTQELWISYEANKCVNPFTGKMQAWTQALTYWKDRVLLSGLAIEPAVAIAAEIRAAAPTRAGLESLTSDAPQTEHSSSAPEMFLEHPEDWLDPDDPGAHRLASLTLHLRRYLGVSGYLCLQACAIYPEIAWNITASAAAMLVSDDEVETVLERLSMLPWMRHGFMPEWLRIGLVRNLGVNEQRARKWLEAYLKSGTPGEQKAEALNVVPGGAEKGAGKGALPEPDRDRVYLWFASGKPLADLSASAPRTWFKLMIAPLIRRVVAALAATAGLSAAACILIASLSRTSPAPAEPAPPPPRPANVFVATMVDATYGLDSLNESKTESAIVVAADVLDFVSPVPSGLDPESFFMASEFAGARSRGTGAPQTGDVALSTRQGGVIQVVRNVTGDGIFIFGDRRVFHAVDFDVGFLDFSTVRLVSEETSPVMSTQPGPKKPADWEESPGPTAGWCYQERKKTGEFGAYCHWSQANYVSVRSPGATGCVYVAGLRKTPWRPAPKGIDDSWWEFPMESALPAPFPQLSRAGAPAQDTFSAPVR